MVVHRVIYDKYKLATYNDVILYLGEILGKDREREGYGLTLLFMSLRSVCKASRVASSVSTFPISLLCRCSS